MIAESGCFHKSDGDKEFLYYYQAISPKTIAVILAGRAPGEVVAGSPEAVR